MEKGVRWLTPPDTTSCYELKNVFFFKKRALFTVCLAFLSKHFTGIKASRNCVFKKRVVVAYVT